MKRCPECRRDYYDDTQLYCLDDGTALLEGPATPEPRTAILSSVEDDALDAETRPFVATTGGSAGSNPKSSAEYIVGEIKRHKIGVWIGAGVLLITVGVVGIGIYRSLLYPNDPVPPRELKFVRLTTGGKIGDEQIIGGATISPDGKRVVFQTQSGGKQSIWIRQVLSNSLVRILGPMEGSFGGSTFSHDGEFVYFGFSDKTNPKQGLFQVSVIGGTPRRVLDDVSSPIAFSPDDKQFAFMREDPINGETYLMAANKDGSGEPRTLATRKFPEYFSESGPSWSPGGKVIACGAGKAAAGLEGIVVEIPADGGAERAITSAKWNNVGRVVWLADGSGLVIDGVMNPLFEGTQIFFISYPAGNARRITNDLNSYGFASLGVTTDANAIVAAQNDLSQPIFAIGPNEDPSHARQISSGKYEGMLSVATTPDGRIVYCDPAVDADDIWIMNVDGSARKQLTDDQFIKAEAAVSPDGRYIVYTSNRSGNENIWRMEIDGNNIKQLTDASVDTSPAISADGKWVVFESLRSGKSTLWKVSIDGGTAAQLTEKITARPAISPDGKIIGCFFFDDQGTPQNRFGLFSFENGEFVKTLDLPQLIGAWAWTPDGRAITFVDESKGIFSNIMSQPIDGGPPKPLTSFKSDRIFNFAWTRDGKQLVYSRGPFTTDILLIKDFR